jgi:hypothetical protein
MSARGYARCDRWSRRLGRKKTIEAIQKEVAGEIERLLALVLGSLRKEGRLDLEALEMATRAAMHRAGAAVLEELLNKPDLCPREIACGCGAQARFHEMRPRQIVTALGRIHIQRPYCVCSVCHQGQSPLDRELDVEGTEYSPAVRRMMADEQGRPVRDEAFTSYTGAIETAEQFGRRLYREAWDRGCSTASRIVVLGDGAPWIWNIADEHFPGAVQIVDLYHARQHLWELGSRLFPNEEKKRKTCVHGWRRNSTPAR